MSKYRENNSAKLYAEKKIKKKNRRGKKIKGRRRKEKKNLSEPDGLAGQWRIGFPRRKH